MFVQETREKVRTEIFSMLHGLHDSVMHLSIFSTPDFARLQMFSWEVQEKPPPPSAFSRETRIYLVERTVLMGGWRMETRRGRVSRTNSLFGTMRLIDRPTIDTVSLTDFIWLWEIAGTVIGNCRIRIGNCQKKSYLFSKKKKKKLRSKSPKKKFVDGP